jgi:hypothetical protein
MAHLPATSVLQRVINFFSLLVLVICLIPVASAQEARTGLLSRVPGAPLSFSQPVAYTTGEPQGIFPGQENPIVVTDVNGDGHPDIVMVAWCDSPAEFACYNGNSKGSVSVLLNNGDGTFQAPLIYSSGGYYAVAVMVADINGDGKPDIIVTNGCPFEGSFCPTEGSVGVLLGNGNGTFHSVVIAPAGGVPLEMGIADVNRDGKLDVLVANQSPNSETDGSVGVLLGNGDGTFQPVQLYDSGGSNATYIVAADLNGDGNPDLLVANLGECQGCSGVMGVLLGNGNGTFQNAVLYGPTYATGLILADMNGDGKTDVVVNQGGVFYGGLFSVVLGNGDGTFKAPFIYDAGGGYNYLPSVADVNGDHILDVVVPSSSGVGVFLGNGDGTLQSPLIFSTDNQSQWITVSDLNGDGIPDIAFAGQGDSKGSIAGVLVGNGDGTFQTAQTYRTGGYDSEWVAAVDLNGDGKPDLIVENATPGANASVGILINTTGSSQASTTTALSSSPDPSTYGQLVTLTASVTSTSGSPTGPVNFYNGATLLGESSLVAGVATFSISSLAVGTYSFTAVYPGNTSFATSTSPPVTQYVNAITKSSTTTAMVSSLNPSIYGQDVTFTATVSNGSGTAPTGKVSFTWSIYSIGSATLNSEGVASLSVSLLNADSFPIVAVYKGDANNLGSSSAVVNQVVEQTTSAATLTSSPNPSTSGEAVTFTAKVTSPTVTAKGPVTFTAGKTVLGTVELSGGKASLTTSALPAGSNVVTVAYQGDSDIKGSSASVTQVVGGSGTATTTMLTYSVNNSTLSETLTAKVTSSGGTPTGTVTLTVGNTTLGSPQLANGQATLTVPTLSVGSNTVTATYNGNSEFASSSVWATQTFVMPYSATMYLQQMGGSAAATTTFGLGTSSSNFVPFYSGLPNNPNPTGQVLVGSFTAGTLVNFGMYTTYGSQSGWAFSIGTDEASIVSFADLSDSLGMNHGITQQTSSTTWVLHLDDALSYLYDDDNNDVIMGIILVP